MKHFILVSSILGSSNAFALPPANSEPLGQPPSTFVEETAKVTAAGTVNDEATRALIVGKLRDLYGKTNVIDRIEVSAATPPPKWADNMEKMLNADLKKIRRGKIQVNGTQISLQGDVANESLRQKFTFEMATTLSPIYTIKNSLTVSNSKQDTLDKALSNRTIEFETGSANLTIPGQKILDAMALAIKQIGNPKIQLIGHTDSAGSRSSNVELSLARANTVRTYLIEKGIPPRMLSTEGGGPDHPISTNDTQQGRAQNRRIEFRLISSKQ